MTSDLCSAFTNIQHPTSSIFHGLSTVSVDNVVEISAPDIAKLLQAYTYRILHKRAAHE